MIRKSKGNTPTELYSESKPPVPYPVDWGRKTPPSSKRQLKVVCMFCFKAFRGPALAKHRRDNRNGECKRK